MNDSIESRYFVEAAAKTLDVLEAFDSFEQQLNVTEIAQRTGMTYSSAFRLMYTLEKRGYVMRRGNAKRFSLVTPRKRCRIGYAAMDESMRFCSEVTRGMVLAARRQGVDLILRDNEQSPPRILANVDELLEQGIQLLVEHQSNEEVTHLISAKCHEARIPIIAVNYSIPGAYYFGGNNYLAGKMAAQFLCRFANGNLRNIERVLILPAKGVGSTQEARVAGAYDGLSEGFPRLRKTDIEIASPGGSVHDGYRATKELLHKSKGKKKILIAAMGDPVALGSCRAVLKMNLGANTCIVGQGGGRDSRRYIQLGSPLRASVAYFPQTYGERIMSLALRILRGEKVQLATYTEHVVLTKAKIERYYPETGVL